MASKVKVRDIRALHAHLTQILGEYDARNSGGEADGEDGAGSGLGAKTLEEKDQPAADDPPETPGTRRPTTNGNMLVPQGSDSKLAKDKGLKAIHPNAEVAARADANLRALIPGFGRVR